MAEHVIRPEHTYEETEKAIDKYLQELWEEMMNDHPSNILRFEGAINLAYGLGAISIEKYELWNLRVEKCPDPDHVGGRVWCAYCGDVSPNEGRREIDGYERRTLR